MDSSAIHPAHQHTARAVGVVGLGAIAMIHLLDLPGKVKETPYLAVAYVLLIAGAMVASFFLISGQTRRGWALGGGLAVATLVGYAINRTVGMPAAMDDIGNWFEPLGLASLVVEVCIALLTAWALTQPAERTHRAARPVGAVGGRAA